MGTRIYLEDLMQIGCIRRAVSVAAAAAVLLIPASCSWSDPAPGVASTANSVAEARAAIQATYDEMNDAFMGNHLDRMSSLLTNDYTQVDPKGHVLTKDGTTKKLQSERNQMKQLTVACVIKNVAPAPNGVLVDMQMDVAGSGQKKMFFMTMHGTFTNKLIAQDYWVNTPNGWLLQSRKESLDQSKTQAG